MHRGLKRFGMNGVINDDSDFIRLREQYETLLLAEMKETGYVPVMDLGPFWSTDLKADGHYNFILSMYGVFVGLRKVNQYIGVDAHGRYYENK